MTRWEYTVVRMDSLKLFQMHLAQLGGDGWEAISANYVMHAPETLESGTVVAERPVWIAVLKRAIEDA